MVDPHFDWGITRVTPKQFERQITFLVERGYILQTLTEYLRCGFPDPSEKRICITFDELPAAKSFGEVDRQAVTYLLLEALKRHKVKAAGFVVGQEIGDSFDLLGQWLNDGHILGSMTFSNQDYNYIGIQAFINDIKPLTEALLLFAFLIIHPNHH